MKTLVPILVALSLPLLSGGCTTVKDSFSKYQTEVPIPFEGEEAAVKVDFAGFAADPHAKAGMSALQIKDWSTAVSEFQQAVASKPKNPQYNFALGVAAEAVGNYTLARESYKAANQLKGGSGHFDAIAGLKRLDLRQGK